MSDWFQDFRAVRNRYLIRGVLEARTGFRVGAGRDPHGVVTDLPVLRDGVGRPFLPGSSLKGVVRSQAERLLRALAHGEEEKRFACDPLEYGGCLAPKRENGKDDEGGGTWEWLQDRACAACATFGGLGLASHVRLFDAFPSGAASVQLRDGVALDRDLGRASDGKKFDFEVGVPGTRFDLRIDLENVMDWQVALVLFALDRIADGSTRIGGFGSRGLGDFGLHDRAVHRLELPDILAGRPGRLLNDETLATILGTLLTDGWNPRTKS